MAELPGTTIIDVYLCEEMNDFEPVHLLDLVGRFHYSQSPHLLLSLKTVALFLV